MGWERRGNRLYYYTAKKIDGRVIKQYAGCGEVAASISGLERLDRERCRAEDALAHVQREEAVKIDALVDEFCGAVDTLLEETLIRAGYHRHDRGAWRKQRVKHEQPDRKGKDKNVNTETRA